MTAIRHVTDTAYWVAAYRAEEDERQDALFKDPFAKKLIGAEGFDLAHRTQGSRYTAWSVVIRTLIIDRFISQLLVHNIDCVLNLGAGLDTRPYRLNLPSQLRWIEVDFPAITEHKNEMLKDETPKCKLERVSLDLSLLDKRKEFLNTVSKESKNVLILTEGVLPYLSNEDVAKLTHDLHHFSNFRYWITEYYSPEILEYLRTPKRLKQMANAPFLFYPHHWFSFFKENGWDEKETHYFGEEAERVGRTPPVNAETSTAASKRFLGYTVFERI